MKGIHPKATKALEATRASMSQYYDQHKMPHPEYHVGVVFSNGRPLRSNGQIADGLTVDRQATVCQRQTVDCRPAVNGLGLTNHWPNPTVPINGKHTNL